MSKFTIPRFEPEVIEAKKRKRRFDRASTTALRKLLIDGIAWMNVQIGREIFLMTR